MNVKDIMTKNPISISEEASLKKAAVMLKEEKVGSLLVVDSNGDLAGIITDRILVVDAIANGFDFNKTQVKEIMYESMVSVTPDMEATKAARLLEELEIRYLPVMEGKKTVGILSISDLANFVKDFIDCILIELGARVVKRRIG
ncbi:MAG: CBS domain-containing protein [Actinomycetota bacterium]|nr:CBS domain-containing protein [Actinomycetota bacterium]